MAFIHYNPNPHGRFVGDCTVRAICKLTGKDWDTVYVGTFFEGFQLKNMQSGQMTQQQFNQLSNQADKVYQMLFGRPHNR